MEFLQSVGEAVQGFWNGLGSARGYVVGAIVTFVGVLTNVRALGNLEDRRAKIQQKQADTAWERQQEDVRDAWERERAARLEELRREAYTAVVVASESRAFIETIPEAQRPEVLSAWRGIRGKVRFVTDDRALIDAADALTDASGKRVSNPQAFVDTRTEFVRLCRAELGRVELDIKTKTARADGSGVVESVSGPPGSGAEC